MLRILGSTSERVHVEQRDKGARNGPTGLTEPGNKWTLHTPILRFQSQVEPEEDSDTHCRCSVLNTHGQLTRDMLPHTENPPLGAPAAPCPLQGFLCRTNEGCSRRPLTAKLLGQTGPTPLSQTASAKRFNRLLAGDRESRLSC